MEKLENSRSEKITSGSKSKKTLLRSSPIKCIINLLKIFKTLYRLKLIRR